MTAWIEDHPRTCIAILAALAPLTIVLAVLATIGLCGYTIVSALLDEM